MPLFAQFDDFERFQRKTSDILSFGSFSARAIFSGSLRRSRVNFTVSAHTAAIGCLNVDFSSFATVSAGSASSDG